MSDSISVRDRYLALIDEIVQITLKGQIRSKEQVYQRLRQDVTPGLGEIFERCLAERMATVQHQKDTQTDELKQAKAIRSLRALQTIWGEWERLQKQNQVSDVLTTALQTLTAAQPSTRLTALLRIIDPNRTPVLTLDQLQQLAKALQQSQSLDQDLQQLAAGLTLGLKSWQRLQDHLVSWIYDQSRGPLGFEGVPGQSGPWAVWATHVNSPLPQALFQTLALNQSVAEWATQQRHLPLSVWVELAVLLQCLQRGLVVWFDKQVYDAKVGAKSSISIFLTFTAIWSELANGFRRVASSASSDYNSLANGCFQIALSILRGFAQRDYFPLYGGIYASFGGEYLRSALNYLDEPLRQVEGTHEKARILTLLGYSLQALGQLELALAFHKQALEIARTAADRPCEIANLNHLSRAYIAQKDYETAIGYSQRALILSRQSGERLGEANALSNLGYSEVFQAQQLESEPEVYETAIHYLQQGLQLSERLGDRQSQALCCSSLGIAHLVISEFPAAIPYLESGLQAAQVSGDLYLQGVNLASLAEAYYGLQNIEKAIYTGSLGMYLLEQIASPKWRQPAGLLTVLQGQLGVEAFQQLLKQQRSQIMALIGVDGYDYIPQLLEQYQRLT